MSVIAHKVLKSSFSEALSFGGSGGHERTGYFWCRCLSMLGYTPRDAWSVLGSGT